jgi:hypothetical protein
MHMLAIMLQDTQPNPEMIQKFLLALIPVLVIGYLVAVALVMVPCWFICRKAGFSPWLSLLCVIPSLGTLVLLYVLAFAEWKTAPVPQASYPPSYPLPPRPPYPPQA